MNLEEAYDTIRSTLPPQVQGTCGLYSFYNAVQILRVINPKLPNVPTPKKCEAPGATRSLRQYAKREFKSGQGEILTEAEMIAFIKAWGYKPLSCGKDDDASKTDFFTIQSKAGHPVLVAYLAGNAPTGIVPVPNAASGQEGGHWSLVLRTHGGNVSVVEPNAPTSLKTWPISALLLSNAAVDSKIFDRYWAKLENEFHGQNPQAYHPQFNPGGWYRFGVPKVFERGVKPVPDPGTWTPNNQGTWAQMPDGAWKLTRETKLYDLGGDTGTRHLRQKLNHVVIAILPPD